MPQNPGPTPEFRPYGDAIAAPPPPRPSRRPGPRVPRCGEPTHLAQQIQRVAGTRRPHPGVQASLQGPEAPGQLRVLLRSTAAENGVLRAETQRLWRPEGRPEVQALRVCGGQQSTQSQQRPGPDPGHSPSPRHPHGGLHREKQKASQTRRGAPGSRGPRPPSARLQPRLHPPGLFEGKLVDSPRRPRILGSLSLGVTPAWEHSAGLEKHGTAWFPLCGQPSPLGPESFQQEQWPGVWKVPVTQFHSSTSESQFLLLGYYLPTKEQKPQSPRQRLVPPL